VPRGTRSSTTEPPRWIPDDDYPATVIPCAEAVRDDPGSLGIVLGGSGNGEQMAANKVKGIRAALAYDISTAQLAREHNDAQVVALGGRMHTLQEALGIVLVVPGDTVLAGSSPPAPHRPDLRPTRRPGRSRLRDGPLPATKDVRGDLHGLGEILLRRS
jgi:hypothetical protein